MVKSVEFGEASDVRVGHGKRVTVPVNFEYVRTGKL
jgi:hypothetical protein